MIERKYKRRGLGQGLQLEEENLLELQGCRRGILNQNSSITSLGETYLIIQIERSKIDKYMNYNELDLSHKNLD